MLMAEKLQPDQVAERIRGILRRDLKLGASAELPDGMALIGGNMDLDSLDVLLLITNIEKEFGVKVASEDVGREAFETVGSLIGFVAGKCLGDTGSAGSVGGDAGSGDPLSRLPHRAPFRFLSRLTELNAGVSGAGVWAVDGSEAFFAGHFPGRPMVPGVLIAEALAQLSGVVGAVQGGANQGKLAQVDVRFLESVAPPAEIVLESKALRTLGALRQFEVVARRNGSIIAQGTVTIAYGVQGGGQ